MPDAFSDGFDGGFSGGGGIPSYGTNRRFILNVGGTYAPEGKAGDTSAPSGFTNYTQLEPTIMYWNSNEVSRLEFTTCEPPETTVANLPMHTAIQLIDTFNSNRVVFQGPLVKYRTVYVGDRTEYTGYVYDDGAYLLERAYLHGQVRLTSEQENTFYQDPVGTDTLTNSYVGLIDTQLIFNEDGKPNRCQQTWTVSGISGHTFWTFDAPDRNDFNAGDENIQSLYWTLDQAVAYILNWSIASSAVFPYIDPATYTDTIIQGVLGNGTIFINNINLEGKPILKALDILLKQHGFGFVIGTAQTNAGGYPITFFSNYTPATTNTVNLSMKGTLASMLESNMIHCDVTSDSTGVVNNCTGYGQNIEWTTLAQTYPLPTAGTNNSALLLIPAWNTNTNSGDINWGLVTIDTTSSAGITNIVDNMSTTGTNVNSFYAIYGRDDLNQYQGSSGQSVYAAGRLFLVNQGQIPWTNGGNTGQVGYPPGGIENLTADLLDPNTETCHSLPINSNNSLDRRKFERPNIFLTNSSNGMVHTEAEYQVDVSIDGLLWSTVPKDLYSIVNNGMGIYFHASQESIPKWLAFTTDNSGMGNSLGYDYWSAIYNLCADLPKALKIRMLVMVKSDQKVSYSVTNSASCVPLATDREFKSEGFRRYMFNNICTANSNFFTNTGVVAFTQDDTCQMKSVVEQNINNQNRISIHGNIFIIADNTTSPPADLTYYFPGEGITGILNRYNFQNPCIVKSVITHFQEQTQQLVVDTEKSRTKVRPHSFHGVGPDSGNNSLEESGQEGFIQ